MNSFDCLNVSIVVRKFGCRLQFFNRKPILFILVCVAFFSVSCSLSLSLHVCDCLKIVVCDLRRPLSISDFVHSTKLISGWWCACACSNRSLSVRVCACVCVCMCERTLFNVLCWCAWNEYWFTFRHFRFTRWFHCYTKITKTSLHTYTLSSRHTRHTGRREWCIQFFSSFFYTFWLVGLVEYIAIVFLALTVTMNCS